MYTDSLVAVRDLIIWMYIIIYLVPSDEQLGWLSFYF